MRLFRSDDPGHGFGELTRVSYVIFLIDFFFNRFAFHEVILIL